MDIELYGFYSEETKQERIDANKQNDKQMPVSCIYLGEYGGEIEVTAVFDSKDGGLSTEYVGRIVKYSRAIFK